MRTSIQLRSTPVGDAVYNASRQVWLASLGAAVVTREWAQADAGKVFRNLVKEGTAVESRTFRLVGDRLEGSLTRANAMWRHARHTVSVAREEGGRHRRDAGAEQPAPLAAEGHAARDADAGRQGAPAKKRAAPKRAPKAKAKVGKRVTRARKAATK